MRVRFSERFRRSYESVPPAIQRTFHRKIVLLGNAGVPAPEESVLVPGGYLAWHGRGCKL
jgi:membrane protein DedA with SNARE-associated domain